MRIRKLLVFIFLIAALSIHGQEAAIVIPSSGPGLSTRADCPEMNAGNARMHSYSGGEMSSPTEVILCAGEAVFISHDGDHDLTQDPDPSTPAGIWYAAFTSPPSETGVITQTQLADLNGIVKLTDGSLIFARGDKQGNFVAINDGSFLEAAGLTAPQQLWFAPVTIHNTDADDPSEYFENGDACIHINSSNAFSIHYLAPLSYEINSTSETEGTITISGGSGNYEVTLINMVYNENIELTGSNATFQYSVRRPKDNHRLTITDPEGGCTLRETISFVEGDPVKVRIPDLQVEKGDEFCLPVEVEDFDDIGIISFTYRWDPRVVSFANIRNVHPAIDEDDEDKIGGNFDRTDEGWFSVMWLDLNTLESISIPDGESLFEVCFTVTGEIGDQTPVYLDGSEIPVDFASPEPAELPFKINNGTITIVPGEEMDFNWSACGSELSVRIFGGQPPYQYILRDESGNETDSGTSSDSELQIIDITAGEYTLHIEDADGESVENTLRVENQPTDLRLETEANRCSDRDPQGKAYISNLPSGHSYQIEWRYNGRTYHNIDTLKGVLEGEVQVRVTDQNHCRILNETGTVANEGITATAEVTKLVPCGSSGTGEAEITVSGGTGNYEYSAHGLPIEPVPGNPFTILLYGPITHVRINDDNDCVFELRIEAETEGGETLENAQETITHIQCGAAGTSASGRYLSEIVTTGNVDDISKTLFHGNGDQVDRIHWNFPSGPRNQLRAMGLEAGDYYWEVEGACATLTIDFTIEDANDIPVQISAVVQSVGCPPGQPGSIRLELSPDDDDYDIKWDHGPRTAELTDLEAGTYTVTVTSTTTGCSATENITLQEGGVAYTTQGGSLDCQNPTPIQIGVTIHEDYESIVWASGETSDVITVAEPGYYYFTITPEDEDCDPVRDSIYVSSSGDIAIRIDTTIINECTMRAMYTVHTTDGTPLQNIEISWDDGPRLTQSEDGDFNTYRISDEENHNLKIYKDGCLAKDTTFAMEFKNAIKIDSSSTNISCFGDNNGRIDVRPANDHSNYTFQLTAGGTELTGEQFLGTFSNLEPGDYTVIVRDQTPSSSSSCPEIELSFTIEEPDLLEVAIDTTSTLSPSCSGEWDGVIVLDVSGGNRGEWDIRYNYQGGAGRTNDLAIDSLKASPYQIRVIDTMGCTASINFTLTDPEAIEFSIPPVEEPQCHGYTTPFTISSASGGTGTLYQYSVDGGVPVPLGEETPILAGSHEIIVYDENGCMEQSSFSLSEPPAIEVLFQQPDTIESSLGQQVDISARINSINPITDYIWMPSGADSLAIDGQLTFTAVDNVVVSLEVVDSDGCIGSGEIFVMVRKKRDIGIPNAFSPNGDGYNDLFTLYPGPSVHSIRSFQIFDRYGTLVWEEKDISPEQAQVTGWDGTYQGSPASFDVYVAVVQVEFIDGQVIRRVSDVTLVK